MSDEMLSRILEAAEYAGSAATNLESELQFVSIQLDRIEEYLQAIAETVGVEWADED